MREFMIKFKIIMILLFSIQTSHEEKLILFDSTKYQDDLNWLRFSFKENLTNADGNELNVITHTRNDHYGWKESSFASPNSDDVWRIYFACDLNVQNLHNWLFLPLINKKQALNRLNFNITFTIRECEQFPLKQQRQLKTCREKFELYYEELDENELQQTDKQTQHVSNNKKLLTKLKQLKFRDTFVSDNAQRYYNQKKQTSAYLKTSDAINVESRDIVLDTNKTFIRFAIRDTGACVSLLSVKVSYLTCGKTSLYGITFGETPTGRESSDLVEVNGQCPLYSTYSHTPKAICTGKGEWLISDLMLNNRCLCLPGYEFIDNYCSPCQSGYYKSSTSNLDRCKPCPLNSWSSQLASNKCDCIGNDYSRDETTQYTLPCKKLNQLTLLSDLQVTLLNKQNEFDLKLDTNDESITLNCFKCDSTSEDSTCTAVKCLNNRIILMNSNKKSERYRVDLNNSSMSIIMNNLNLENIQVKTLKCRMYAGDNDVEMNKCFKIQFQFNLYQPRELINHLKIYSTYKQEYNYSLVKVLDSITNAQIVEFTYCNNLNTKRNDYDLSSFYFKLQFEYINQANKLLIYLIDLNNLQNLCASTNDPYTKTTTPPPSTKNTSAQEDLVKFDDKLDVLGQESFDHDKIMNLTLPQTQPQKNNQFKVKIILPCVLIACLFILVAIVVVIIFVRRLSISNYTSTVLKKSPLSSHNSSTLDSVDSSSQSTTITHILSQSSSHAPSKLYYIDPHTYEDPSLAVQQFANEINPQDIKIESVIGGGEFGDVCKGKLRTLKSDQWITVAIKTLKTRSSERNRCDFLTEASIMAQFQHENIIYLEGVVTKSNPYMILLEYMENGSLDTYLRLNSWKLSLDDLLRFLRDVASGMQYLSEMSFVHRDLAARNILLNKDLRCKVADFGLSRELETDNTDGAYWTKGGKIPVRWTAPEAINYRKFTTSSDIWSYGVLAWEVMTYGERPYWNWSNQDVLKSVEKGFRLPAPPNACPTAIYQLMLKCWCIDRLERPKFRHIVQTLDAISMQTNLLNTHLPQNNLNAYIDSNKPNISQLTCIDEWLQTLNLSQYSNNFKRHSYLSLFQVLNIQSIELNSMGIWNQSHQKSMIDSLKAIKLEIAFRNGFLV